MALDTPPQGERPPHPERNPGNMPDHAPEASPVIPPEQEAARQEGIARANENLAGQRGKEGKENHAEKHEGHGGEKKPGAHDEHSKGHDSHADGHGHPKKPGFFENVTKTMKRNKGATVIVGSGTIGTAALAVPAAAWTGGYGMSFVGQHLAASGFQWGAGIAHAGSEFVGASAAMAPYLLPIGLVGVGIAAGFIWGPMLLGGGVVDRLFHLITNTKPAAGGGAKAADHGGGHGGGHGH